MKGLDTVKVLQDGTVTLHRRKRLLDGQEGHSHWETATLHLPAESLARVLDAVEKNRLLTLDPVYDGGLTDGIQWVFWFRQGQEKSVYFNNRFPGAIVRFAEALDTILVESGSENADWHDVPDADGRKHERELWESIER